MVFLEILPQLGEGQEVVTRAVGPALAFLKNHIYIVALLGLFTFYVVERVVRSSRWRRREAGQGDETSEGVFWMNISWFSVKNATVGYLLLREERTLLDLLLFFVAIGLEFLLSDRGLHNDHKVSYGRIGRWVLVAALFLGWGSGYFTEVSELVLAVLSAFLAGIIHPHRPQGETARGEQEQHLGLCPRCGPLRGAPAGPVRAVGHGR